MVMIAACKFLFDRAAIFRSLRENVERRDRQANSRVRRNSQAGAGTGFWMAMRRGLGSDEGEGVGEGPSSIVIECPTISITMMSDQRVPDLRSWLGPWLKLAF